MNVDFLSFLEDIIKICQKYYNTCIKLEKQLSEK